MDSRLSFHRQRAPLISVLLALAGFACGCGSSDIISRQESQIEILRYENERRREFLGETIEELELHRKSLVSGETEKGNLGTRLVEIESELRSAQDVAGTLKTERDEARTKLTDLEGVNERLRESMTKVKNVASASAGELAELRLKEADLSERAQKLAKVEATLKEENASLARELEAAKAELVRSKAVVRSFREGGSATGNEVVDFWSQEQARLEREIAGLKGENAALKQRITVLAGESPAGAAAHGADGAAAGRAAGGDSRPGTAGAGLVYRENPAGLLSEAWRILQDRFEAAKQGKIAWDGFDFTVVGVAVVVVLALITLLRWLRRGSRRAVSGSPQPAQSSAGESGLTPEAQAPAGRREPLEGGRARRLSPVHRRTSFSPVVISQSTAATSAAAAPAASVSQDTSGPRDAEEVAASPDHEAKSSTDPFEAILDAASARAPKNAEPRAPGKDSRAGADRKVIGARSWDTKDEESEHELASTQILPKVEPVVAPRPGRKGAAASNAETEATHIVKRSDDRDLLQDLKSVINKKFDEILKK